MNDEKLEPKVESVPIKKSLSEKVSEFYYGLDFYEADLVPGSEIVFSLNKPKERKLISKAADLGRAGIVEALRIGGYIGGAAFLYYFFK